MIKVTHKEHHERIGSKEDVIILSGPPSSLNGLVTFHNESDEKILVRDLMVHTHKNQDVVLPVGVILQPREVKAHLITYSMDPHTPPGRYEMTVQLGKTRKKVLMVVHESMHIQLSPRKMVLNGIEGGQVHEKEVLFSNMGNIDLFVPSIRHGTIQDRDITCRNLGLALRTDAEEGVEKTLDVFTRGIKKDLSDFVKISIKEAGEVVKPGQAILLHIAMTVPKVLKKNYNYEGEFSFYYKAIRYQLIDKTPVENPQRQKSK